MLKLILLLVVGVVIYLFWRAGVRKEPASPMPPRAPAKQPERMVSCAICALRIPESEALKTEDGRYFCCHEHFQTGQQSAD